MHENSLAENLYSLDQCHDKGIYFVGGSNVENFFSYSDLLKSAKGLLSEMRLAGFEPGDEIVFQITDNKTFLIAFWSCILGGYIPVPLSNGDNLDHKKKIINVLKKLNKPRIVSDIDLFDKIHRFTNKEEIENLEHVFEHSLCILNSCVVRDVSVETSHGSAAEIALIQFSSGSTGDPKGVMLTHQNLLENIKDLMTAGRTTTMNASMSWMPLTHDMGLIGFHLVALCSGINQFIMPTSLFVRNPIKWLEIADKYRINQLYSPNFGLKHTLDALQNKRLDLDLSCIRSIVNGAEPISDEICQRFINELSPFALANHVMIPVYGLAEASVGVTASPAGERYKTWFVDRHSLSIGSKVRIMESKSRSTISFVDLGFPLDGCSIRICGLYGEVVEEGTLGLVEISGANVTQGYYGCVDTNIQESKWLNTEDIGFILNGRLVVTGRYKDTIVIQGQNYFAHDIEQSLEVIRGLELNKVVATRAVSEELLEEGLAIFVLYRKKDYSAFIKLAREIRATLVKIYGFQPAFIIPVRHIPKTTSGKLQRHILSARFQNNEYATIVEEIDRLTANHVYEEMSVTENKLFELWATVLGHRNFSRKDRFFELGGHSLKAAKLVMLMNAEFGVDYSMNTVFHHSTIAELAAYIEQAGEKRMVVIPETETREHYPVSAAQKRQYLLQQLGERQITYNMPGAFMLEGECDRERLSTVIKGLVQRHESLRTSFALIKGEIMQSVHPEVSIELDYVERPETMEIETLIQDFVRPFDLSKAPLFRAALVKLSKRRHLLMMDMPHIISDGISTEILINEFARLYAGEKLSPLRIQYKEFALWQNALLQSGQMEKQRSYWLETLAGPLPILEMPTDYVRPKLQTFEGDRISFTIHSERLAQLKQLAQQTESTLYMVLLAAYTTLLYKYTEQEDIVIGSPIAGRTHADLEPVVGMFVNTLALRHRPTGEKSFLTFLQEVKSHALQAYEHQDYPFDKLVEELAPTRDLSRNPLFDTMFALQNMERQALELDGLKVTSLPGEGKVAKFDLTLTGCETEKGLDFTLEYASRLYRRETAERLVEHWKQLLIEIVRDPTQALARINILSADEEQLLDRFNQTETVYPRDQTVIQLFEAQVDRTPDAVAIVFGEAELTYRELNQKANQLARELRTEGVGPEQLVGIMVERSLEMIIGILGILKAGGAYVPIDPAYPQERIEYMLSDSGTRWLLTETRLANRVVFTGRIILLDQEDLYIGAVENLQPECTAGNLIYVMYTSGSTGKPKGVMIEHRGVVRLVKDTNYLHVGTEDTILQSASYSFDAATLEIWASLLNGAKLALLHKGILSLENIEESITAHDVTVVFITTALFTLIVDNRPETFKGLKSILVGGDVLSLKHVKKIRSMYAIELINGYGPTENTTLSTFYRIGQRTKVESSIPIGIPISNSKAYILDDKLMKVPIGVEGELCLAGDGIARGYLNLPQLSAERFIPNPYAASGERMYRTGDRARWLHDGTIEFLGRIDNQVKIRGYRIELGEIESLINMQKGISEAVVVARVGQQGQKYLCAYVVTESRDVVADLRQRLANQLPEFMIPARILEVEELPLTPSGKLDRKALPEPSNSLHDKWKYEAPRTATEVALAGIWRDVLSTDYTIGIRDHFFDIGGNSLNAMMVAYKVNRELGVELTIREIFQYPTIAELAICVEQAVEGECAIIPKIETREHYPVSAAQKRQYLLQRLSEQQITYNMPGAFMLEGECDHERLLTVIKGLVQRHESLRTSFTLINGEIMQSVHPEVSIELDYVERPETMEIETLIQDFVRPFDLSKAPLFRAVLVKLAKGRHLLMMDMPHIISDGISTGILINEFAHLYAGETLLPLRIQYKEFALWQNALLQSEQMEKQRSYWQETLAGPLPILEMPTDYVRPKLQTFEGDRISFTIQSERLAQLKQLAQQTESTLYMVLLAAYTTLLYKYTEQEDIVIGSPIAGRTHADLEPVVGMFVNTLALRHRPTGEKSFLAFLQEVKDHAIQAYQHQDYPFDVLVEELAPTRDLSRNPLFDTMFALQNMERQALELDGLKVTSLPGEGKVAKFDLTLTGWETEKGLDFTLEYASDLYRRETAERLVEHWIQLLVEIVRDPTQALARINILSADEEQLLDRFNQTETVYPRDQTVHQLFEAQVERTPDAVAVVFEEAGLSYRELNQKANQLARKLRAEGVGPEQLVGIMVERSLEMIIGVLGILKAGGAYVPIDPNYPQDRIKYMLSDSGTRWLLTHTQLAGHVVFQGQTILLDQDELYVGGVENLMPESKANNLIYVMYTSGSTGKPKGVMIENYSVVNYLHWMQREYPLDATDVILQKTPFSFDISIRELLLGILNGGKIVFLTPGAEKKPDEIAKAIQHYKITRIHFIPSMLQVFMHFIEKSGHLEQLSTLRYVFLGGEALKAQHLRKFFGIFDNHQIRLINLYGPTETTIDVTYYECSDPNQKVLIGRAEDNIRLYIIGKHGQRQGIGLAGELCVAGDALARGYLNKRELTEKQFIENPLVAGERIYRTGDRARWLSDGNIEYLGRLDHQVKIRGYRIELGEIEHELGQQQGIQEAAVVTHEDQHGQAYLSAYIVSDNELTVTQLRNRLSKQLPEYMIPAQFIRIEQMPVTSNGKLDRKALPTTIIELQSGREYIAPTTAVEKALVEVWDEILNNGRPIGVRDHFFELGGHSLLLFAVAERINRVLSIEISLEYLYRFPILEDLAQEISSSRALNNEAEQLGLFMDHDETQPILFCFPPIEAHAYFYHNLKFSGSSIYAFNFIESANMYLEYAHAVINRQPEGKLNILGYSAGGNLAFEVVKQIEKLTHREINLIIVDSKRKEFEEFESDDTLMSRAFDYYEEMKRKHQITNEAVFDMEKALAKNIQYMKYLNRLVNGGKLTQTNVFLIKSEENQQLDLGWSEVSDHYIEYQGDGAHTEMFDKVNVRNFNLIENILRSVRGEFSKVNEDIESVHY